MDGAATAAVLSSFVVPGRLDGMTFGPRVTGMYDQLDKPRRLGHFFLAIDPARFAGGPTLAAAADEMIADLKSRGAILAPGDPELEAERERREAGIPVEPAAFADMARWSEKLGVAMPPVIGT